MLVYTRQQRGGQSHRKNNQTPIITFHRENSKNVLAAAEKKLQMENFENNFAEALLMNKR